MSQKLEHNFIYHFLYRPTTFDAGFRGLSEETVRQSNGDDSNESNLSLQPSDYRYTRHLPHHHGSSESSLASAPVS